MEVTGITSTNPSKVGNDSYEYTSDGSNSSILEYLKNSSKKQDEVLEVVKNGNNALIKEQKKNTGELSLNTQAISDLTNAVRNMKMEVELNGVDGKLFESMSNLANKPKAVEGIKRFGDIYASVVGKIADLSSRADEIDNVTESMKGAFGTVMELGKGLVVFSAGLALLGFTLVTFMEEITLEDMVTFASIMGIIYAASELIGEGSWDLAKVSIGIATLGLSIWGFTEVVDAERSWDFLKSITMISAGLFIISKASKGLSKSYGSVIKGSLAIASIAGSVWLLNEAVSGIDDVDVAKMAKFALVTGGLGAVWWGMGKFMGSIVKGSVAAAAIGGSLWVLSKGIGSLSEIDLSLERGLELAAITVAAAGILTIIGNPATIGFTLAGAAATAAIGGALWTLSKGMQSISKVSVTEEQSKSFGNSIVNVVDGLSYLGDPMLLASLMVAVPASFAVTGATLAVTGAIWAVSKMPILKDKKIESFGNTLESLMDTYSDLGLWGLAKATAASAVVAVMSGATILSATAILAFTKISSKPEAVDNAVLSLDKFITGVSGTLEKNSDKFSSIEEGIGSFMGLATMTSEIADSVQRISNMEFLEKEVRNGKVVVTGVRNFTPDDFKAVGKSIGHILNALTDPLSKIASKKESYSIGGFTVTNPFSNKVQEGIEAMAGIGGIFTPLAEVITVFNKEDFGKEKVKEFNKNIADILNGVSNAFKGDLEIDEDVLETMGTSTSLVGDMVGYVSKEGFGKNAKSFKGFSESVVSVKNSLKGMELDKLSKFNDLIFNMNEMDKSGALDEFVEAFKEFLEKLSEMSPESTQQVTVREQQQTPTPYINQNNTPAKKEGVTQNELRDVFENSNSELIEIMDRIYSYLSSGNLEVNLKEDL